MKRSSLPLAVALLTTATFLHAGNTPVSVWNIADHIPLGKIIVQSHRGAGMLAEENTVAALELGWMLGTYPESDLRTTNDQVDPATAKTSAKPFTLSQAFIIELGRELRQRDILFRALHTSDTAVHAKLLDLGLMSFATDYPDVTMRELKKYCEARKVGPTRALTP